MFLQYQSPLSEFKNNSEAKLWNFVTTYFELLIFELLSPYRIRNSKKKKKNSWRDKFCSDKSIFSSLRRLNFLSWKANISFLIHFDCTRKAFFGGANLFDSLAKFSVYVPRVQVTTYSFYFNYWIDPYNLRSLNYSAEIKGEKRPASFWILF